MIKRKKTMSFECYDRIRKALSNIGLEEWKTKRNILNQLKENGVNVSDRQWYMFVEKHNLYYCDHLENRFIAHSKTRGYIITNDYELIRASWRDFEKTAKNLLWKVSRYKRGYAEHNNMSIMQLEAEEVKLRLAEMREEHKKDGLNVDTVIIDEFTGDLNK